MDVIIPTLLFLVLLAGLGASVANYGGMTIPEALDWCKTHHDYTCSDSAFQQLYDDWSDIKYANRTITYQDVQKVLGYGEQLYQGALSYTDAFVQYFLGAYDSTWTSDASSREIRVYDDEGNLIGNTAIIGITDSRVAYQDHIATAPPFSVAPNRNSALLFKTTDQIYGTYYHTNLLNQHFGAGISAYNFSPSVGTYYEDNATNVSFEVSGSDILLKMTRSGAYGTAYYGRGSAYQLVEAYKVLSPVLGNNDVETDVPYIGTAEADGGASVGIRPDGSIVLPDGSVVYPSSSTGLYPDSVTNVRLDDDYWARLADLLARDATGTPATSADSTVTNLNLEGIRSILASIKQSIDGLGNTIKRGLTDFFTFPFDKFNVQSKDWFNKILDYIRLFLRGYGVNV